MRVLLVEDNEDDAILIREELSETNIEIEHAERLSIALDRLLGGGVDAVLLDLSLPDACGLDTIGRVLNKAPGVPIVVLTGLNDEEAAVQAVERGAQDYLIKGQVDGHLLARSLRYALQRHRAEEALKERNRELLILKKISEIILGSLDLNPILEQTLEESMRIGSFDLGNIRLLDISRDVLEVVVAHGYRNEQNVRNHRAISRSVEFAQSSHFRELMFTGACVEEHVQSSDGLKTLKREGVESFVQVPIRADGEVLGIIQLATRTRRTFRREEINLLETMGNQMGIAIQRTRLYEETKRQARELEKANQLQADFAAMIAHDLRSPLMNISGAAEVMINGMFGEVNDEQKRWLGKILGNSHNLVNLVSDFLDVAKLEAGYVELSREQVDLQDLIDKTIDNFLIVAQKKDISLMTAAPGPVPLIRGDRRRLEQVVSNLVSNAINFTPTGGHVELGIAAGDNADVRIWVRDDGVGIPREEVAKLFEKYRQGTNAAESTHRGTGLGLVICKMVVQSHGGRIWVESEQGKGSVFFISLPVSK